MISVLFSVAVCAVYSLSCLGLGWLVAIPFARWSLRPVVPRASFDLAALASSFLIGSSVVAALLTMIGLLGLLSPALVALILVPGLIGYVLGVRARRPAWERIRQAVKGLRKQPIWLVLVVVSLLVVSAGFAVAAWFTPPKGDAAAFYLVYPKIMAAGGILLPMPGVYEAFSMIGLSAEYHFAALMVLADLGAAKLFMVFVALACAGLLSGLVGVAGGGAVAAVLGCAVLLTSSTFHLYVFDGKVDLVAAAFGLAAAYWLVLPSTGPRYSSFVASGIFAGLATVSKFSYIPTLGMSLLILLLWRASLIDGQGRSFSLYSRRVILGGVLLGGAAVLGWLPQLLKNAALFDAPLAPFLGVAGSGEILNQAWFSAGTTWQIVLTYPLALVLGRYPMQGGGLSFLMVSFLPLMLWQPRPSAEPQGIGRILALAGIAAVVTWVVLRPSVIAPRYILASLLLLVPVLVIRVEELLREGSGPAFLRVGVFASVMAAIAGTCWQLMPIPPALVSTWRGADKSCLMASPECVPLTELSAEAAAGDRMLVATYYAYWLKASHLQCRDTGAELAHIQGGQADLLRWLQRRAFRYAVVDPVVYPVLVEALDRLAGESSEVLVTSRPDSPLRTYRIAPDSGAEMRCVNVKGDRWHLEPTGG